MICFDSGKQKAPPQDKSDLPIRLIPSSSRCKSHLNDLVRMLWLCLLMLAHEIDFVKPFRCSLRLSEGLASFFRKLDNRISLNRLILNSWCYNMHQHVCATARTAMTWLERFPCDRTAALVKLLAMKANTKYRQVEKHTLSIWLTTVQPI